MAAAIKDYIDLSQDDSCDFCDSDVDFQPESLKPIKYSSTLGKRKDTSKQIAKAVARDSKQAAKEREKEIKAQEKILQKQESGGFKNEEIALIMETNLSLSESIGALLLNFIQPEYHAFAYDFPLSGLCMWTHRRKLEGGFANINNESTRTLDFSVVLFDSDRFIQLITGGGHSVDFLDLRVEIDSMKATIAGFQDNGQSRMILVIRDFDKAANAKIKKKGLVSTMSSTDRYDDAVAFLAYEMDIEVVKLKTDDDVVEYLKSVTRFLAESVYTEPPSELDTVVKKSKKNPMDHALSAADKESYELRKTWQNILCQVPRVSETMSSCFSKKYACPQDLYKVCQGIETMPLREKQEYFMLDFEEKGMLNTSKCQKKVSRVIYKMMTSIDPCATLDDEA